ncbi:MAG: hypothetical protein ACKVOM_13465, partial [Ferruginibacter sp.]
NDFPSVLIEAGYLTNDKDAAYLLSDKGQDVFAKNVLDGISKYALSNFDSSVPKIDNRNTIGYYLGKPVTSYLVNIVTQKCTIIYADNTSQIITLKEAQAAYIIAPPPIKSLRDEAKPNSNHFIDLNPPGNYEGQAVLRTSRNREETLNIMLENNEDKTTTIAEAKKAGLPIPLSPTKILDKVFTQVENEPVFAGGVAAWRKFLETNLDASIAVKEGLKPGTYTFITKFIVSEDGILSDFSTENLGNLNVARYCIEVIKNGPKWIPAKQNGHTVAAYRKQPITFIITEETRDDKKSITNLDPVFRIGNLSNGRVLLDEFKKQKIATVTDNYEITEATVLFAGNGFPKVEMVKLYGNDFTKLKTLVDKCLSGTNIVFMNIKVKNSLGIRVIDEKAYSLY